MNLKRSAVFAAIAAATLLAACEQRQQTTRVEPAVPATSSSSSATLSSADPSLPSADAAFSSSKSESDASNHTATTPVERDRHMPLKGQVNDYNTPDRAKESDQPNTASKEPGGQEARPGTQTEEYAAGRSPATKGSNP